MEQNQDQTAPRSNPAQPVPSQPDPSPATPTPPTLTEPPKKKPLVMILILLILIALVGLAAVFVYGRYRLQKTQMALLEAQTQVDTQPTTTISPTETASQDLKKYTSQDHHISFSYPSSMVIEETNNYRNYGQGYWGLYIWKDQAEYDYCHQMNLPEENKCRTAPDLKITTTKINDIDLSISQKVFEGGKTFYYYIFNPPSDGVYYYYYDKNQPDIITVDLNTTDVQNITGFDQILGSLEYLN